ncbi:molybdate transport system ATP-binding protein [Flaviramulus basaltis]|uniref:Molybdate transport system ATP-binding protein n=1 Tax=Flaviramulus basaltis TaxID=369401 RepID=A0A1K2IHS8_9FLAO|nr:ATP-binding cassette domain-containing protein [Flaviramulus basaltis]SFZ91826.1 molybdate transport system ATP-binding protein [Flaviramulus basaltis]
MYKHIAVYISNKDNKGKLIERLMSGKLISAISNLEGALFSEITLNKFIAEEIRHGSFNVKTETNNSLQYSSEGERKKALLTHIISRNPEFIVVDNVFGNLDVNAQIEIEKTLRDLSQKIPVIQITNRKNEILSFIKNNFQLQGENLVAFENIPESQDKSKNESFIHALPKPENPVKERYNSIVEFNNVSVTYGGRNIINNINWKIKPAEFWHLKGPNGSGKSTILSMIFGDNPKAYGQNITLFGVKKGSGESVWEIKRKIGYFSSDMLRGFSRLDAIGNMIVSGFADTIGLYKTPTNEQIKIAQQWLHVLDMFDIRKQPFLSLSKGHQRLVLIARAMVKNPPLLILDEPTNGLDDADAKLFTKLINKIAAESNTAILYVSHRKEENLKPHFIFELVPENTGSIGKQIQ